MSRASRPSQVASRAQGPASAADAGWAGARLGFPAPPAVRSLLTLGGGVEVLSSPEARAEFVAGAAEVPACYGVSAERPGG